MATTNTEWISPKAFCEEFGMALSTQAKYRREKGLPYSKIGGFILYSRTKIYEWLYKHTITRTEGVLG